MRNRIKITIIIVSMLLLVLTTWEIAVQTQKPILLGDVNNNGAIDEGDLDLVQQHLLQARELSQKEQIKADMNQDGEITVLDLLRIHKYIGGD